MQHAPNTAHQQNYVMLINVLSEI